MSEEGKEVKVEEDETLPAEDKEVLEASSAENEISEQKILTRKRKDIDTSSSSCGSSYKTASSKLHSTSIKSVEYVSVKKRANIISKRYSFSSPLASVPSSSSISRLGFVQIPPRDHSTGDAPKPPSRHSVNRGDASEESTEARVAIHPPSDSIKEVLKELLSSISSDPEEDETESEEDDLERQLLQSYACEAQDYLETQSALRFVKKLASGTFGSVAVYSNVKERKNVAVKVTPDRNLFEIHEWIQLHHDNILQCFQVIDLDEFLIFIMPLMLTDFWQLIVYSKFFVSKESFEIVLKFILDLCHGLEFLHDRELCHLDLKLDNLFLKEEWLLVIGDFSHLQCSEKIVSNYPLIESYCPPEVTGHEPTTYLDGRKIDAFQCGLVILDIVTKASYTQESRLEETTPSEILSSFMENRVKLGKKMHETFKAVKIRAEDVDKIFKVLAMLLQRNPILRLTPKQALEKFLTL